MVPTPDGELHRGGVHNIQILRRDLLKEFLRKSSAKISGGQGHCDLLRLFSIHKVVRSINSSLEKTLFPNIGSCKVPSWANYDDYSPEFIT